MLSPIPPKGHFTTETSSKAPLAQRLLESELVVSPRKGGSRSTPGSKPGVVARHSPFSDGAKTHRGFS